MLFGTLSGKKLVSGADLADALSKYDMNNRYKEWLVRNWDRMNAAQRAKVLEKHPEFEQYLPQKTQSKKTGGKLVKPRELPKYQYGGRNVAAPVAASTIEEQETPLRTASNVWETLTPADKKEITATAIDVAGALAGLTGP